VRVRPERQLRALLQNLRAARQPRAQCEREHLVERFIGARRGIEWRGTVANTNRRHLMSMNARSVPVRGGFHKIHIAAYHVDALVVCLLERPAAVQHVGDLAHQQPQVRRFDANVFKAQKRPSVLLVVPENVRVQFKEGERHSPLDAAVKLEHLDLHVDGI
jgi:hypothetical protein